MDPVLHRTGVTRRHVGLPINTTMLGRQSRSTADFIRLMDLERTEAPRMSLPFSYLEEFTLPGAGDGRYTRAPDFLETRNSRRPSRMARRFGVWHGGDSDRRVPYCTTRHHLRGSTSVHGALHRDSVGTGTRDSIRKVGIFLHTVPVDL